MSVTKVRERGIIMTGESVRATFDDRKTQTRRVCKVQPTTMHGLTEKPVRWVGGNGRQWFLTTVERDWWFGACPYGEPGDRLWVRESFAVESNFNLCGEDEYPPPFSDGRPVRRHSDDEWGDWWQQCHYAATDPKPSLVCEHERCGEYSNGECSRPWRSPRFMPRWASRITLEITAARVERLQEISAYDAQREGIEVPRCHCEVCSHSAEICPADQSAYIEEFAHGWDGINAKRGYSWASNPWVWVITFRKA